MKMSRRARRMEKNHKRKKPFAGFNLVSLMDIFTILVFFLLVNSSDVEVLPSTQGVALPESSADQKARESIVILVNEKDILVQGRKVATVQEAMATSRQSAIRSLESALRDQKQRAVLKLAKGKTFNGEVTIMGDKEIPYHLLKKIMVTCANAQYGRISLAVMHKVKESG